MCFGCGHKKTRKMAKKTERSSAQTVAVAMGVVKFAPEHASKTAKKTEEADALLDCNRTAAIVGDDAQRLQKSAERARECEEDCVRPSTRTMANIEWEEGPPQLRSIVQKGGRQFHAPSSPRPCMCGRQ